MPDPVSLEVGPVTRRVDNSKIFISILFAGFIVTGVATVLLAPLLPMLSAKWTLSDNATGALFTSQFLGSMVGTLCSGILIRKLGFGKALFLGYALMGIYALGLLRVPWPYLMGMLSLNGLGLGLVIPATNMAISDTFPDRRAAALNLINLAWSVGAIACPVLLALAVRAGVLPGVLVCIGGTSIAAASIALRAESRTGDSADSRIATPVPRIPLLILAALFFLYIGAEGAIAGWLATYTKRVGVSSGVLWMTAPSYFWTAMMCGRAIAPLLLRQFKERSVVLGGLMVGCAGVFSILSSGTTVWILAAAMVTGFGLSGVFPIFIAMASHYFGAATTRVSPYLFAMAGLGGAVLPWLVGVFSSLTGKLQVGLVVALVGVAAQLILVLVLSPLYPSNENVESS